MSLLNTRMNNLRVSSPELDMYTLVMPRTGALSAFVEGNEHPQSILNSRLIEQARSAVGRDVQVPVFDSESVTIGSTRSVTIADDENTSQLYTVSFTTYAWGFTVIPSLFMNNELAVQEDFNRKFLKYIYQFLDDLDAAGVSALDTAKNQVFTDLLSYTNVANAVEVPFDKRNEIMGDLSPIMKANKHYGPYMVVGNSGIESQILKMSEFSLYNQQNRTIQWNDKRFRFTTNIANAANKEGTGYAIQEGALGILFRHEREAILGRTMSDGTTWGITNIPGTNIPLDSYFYEGKGDYSAIAGAASADMTRAYKEFYGWSIEVAFVTPYSTDLTTYSNPIVKFQLAESGV
jgi:hypothetical protein